MSFKVIILLLRSPMNNLCPFCIALCLLPSCVFCTVYYNLLHSLMFLLFSLFIGFERECSKLRNDLVFPSSLRYFIVHVFNIEVFHIFFFCKIKSLKKKFIPSTWDLKCLLFHFCHLFVDGGRWWSYSLSCFGYPGRAISFLPVPRTSRRGQIHLLLQRQVNSKLFVHIISF